MQMLSPGTSLSIAEGALRVMKKFEGRIQAAVALTLLTTIGAGLDLCAADAPLLIRSARSGRWSEANTWEGSKLPAAGSRVQIRAGHTITYDIQSDRVI